MPPTLASSGRDMRTVTSPGIHTPVVCGPLLAT